MLIVNTVKTVNGIASKIVGTSDTRATNQLWSRNSRHAHGGRKICTKVSSDMAKKPPRALMGFAADASLSKAGSHHVESSAMRTQLTAFIDAGHHPGEVCGDM
jgi:hypothetical protein